MDAKTDIKKRLPSRHVTEGPERAPHRSYLYAMGLTTQQIHQPFVGVASCWNEAAPCNISLMRQAQAVKKGVAAAGGTPREFCTITVTDGIAMGHDGMRSSLPSRECIADSVELTVRGHAYDALVGLAGCDKSLPGMMMAMVRLNVPSVFIYGGSILPGNFRGQQVTVQDMFEAVGKHSVGEMSDADLDEIERVACPSAGACGAQFTANTMATVSEAIGLALPYSAGAPAPYEIRDAFCTAAGEKVVELIAANIRPRDIVTRRSLENAAAVVAASGGSTNAALHLPAIAHECGIKFDLFDVAEIFKKTPYVADLKPGGRYVAKDMFEVGGIPLLMKTLLDNGHLHGDCLTVTGRTIAENLKSVKWNPHQDVVRSADNPITVTGGCTSRSSSCRWPTPSNRSSGARSPAPVGGRAAAHRAPPAATGRRCRSPCASTSRWRSRTSSPGSPTSGVGRPTPSPPTAATSSATSSGWPPTDRTSSPSTRRLLVDFVAERQAAMAAVERRPPAGGRPHAPPLPGDRGRARPTTRRPTSRACGCRPACPSR